MKKLLLLIALSGAGYHYQDQVRVWLTHHQAPEGTYYLRQSYPFNNGAGIVNWSPGKLLRAVSTEPAANGAIRLTDGVYTVAVPPSYLTRDVEDGEAFQKSEAASQRTAELQAAQESTRLAMMARANAGTFHETTLDRPASFGNIVSTAGGYNSYVVTTTSAPSEKPPVRLGSAPPPKPMSTPPPPPLVRH